MWKPLSVSLPLALLLAACNGSDTTGTSVASVDTEAESAVSAVELVVEAIGDGEFATAAALTVPGQAALAALSEGASFADVASALRDGDQAISANFWAGFAQGAGDFLTGTVTAVEDGSVESDDVDFYRVKVLPPGGSTRLIFTRDLEGHHIDLFASFSGGLASRMLTPVERLLGAQTEDSGLILKALSDVVPSLLVAADSPDVSVEARQQILALVELITRVN